MAHILIIDDNEAVRRMVRKHLNTAGHEVREAADGAAAMAVLEGEMVDLVITDLYMPKMDGVEFLQRLGQKRPGLKIIAMSGGGFADKVGLLEAAQRLGARHTVSKPFERAELLEAVDAALQG